MNREIALLIAGLLIFAAGIIVGMAISAQLAHLSISKLPHGARGQVTLAGMCVPPLGRASPPGLVGSDS